MGFIAIGYLPGFSYNISHLVSTLVVVVSLLFIAAAVVVVDKLVCLRRLRIRRHTRCHHHNVYMYIPTSVAILAQAFSSELQQWRT